MKKILFLVLFVTLIVAGWFIGKPYYDLHFSAIDIDQHKLIYIPTGSDLSEVGRILEDEGVMKKDAFNSFAEKLDFTEEKVEPGKYEFQKGMKNKNVIYALKNGNQELKDVRITFNLCRDIYDMAGKVAPNIEADSVAIVNYIADPKTMEKYGFRKETISALFLSDTYEVGEWDMTAEEFVERMAKEFKSFWNAERKAKAVFLQLTQSEVATLASIVEAEQSTRPDEWPRIAGLYLNRIKKGMLLQSDPTAKFCWGDELEGVKRLLNIHMEKDCPYNTYLYAGLPPGPIRMASKKAIDAVLNAEKHDYLYMCAKPGDENGYSGLHNFAKSYNQHLVNARKFQSYMRSIGH